MDINELQARARELLERAADSVHYAAHPGDELGSTGPDADVLDPIVSDLNEVRKLLGPGIGRADTQEGLPKLRETVRRMEGLVMTPAGQGGPIFLTETGRGALRDAVRLLKQVEQLYA